MNWKNNLDWIRGQKSLTLEKFNTHFNTQYTLKRLNAMLKYHNIPTIPTKRFWTKEQLDWLEENKTRDRAYLIKQFNKRFDKHINMSILKSAIHRYRLDIPCPRIHWTQDKLDWLEAQEYTDLNDLVIAFNNKYKSHIKKQQLEHIGFLYKIKLPPSVRVYAPVGTVMHGKHGIEQIKISDSLYMSKHRYLYEQYHNIKLNGNDAIIFLDGDNTNFNIENLYKINYAIHARMSTNGYYKLDRLPVIKTLEWKELLNDYKRNSRTH